MAVVDEDKRAPMASAPMKYQPDGDVDWGNMWDSFCALASEGGPPHRGTMLHAQEDADVASAGYRFAIDEISRGIAAVSGLTANAAAPGWIAVECQSAAMAHWLADAIIEENVQARADRSCLLVPVGDSFTLTSEIKNVITAVAKTTHYWHDHLPVDVKRTLAVQAKFSQITSQVLGRFRRRA